MQNTPNDHIPCITFSFDSRKNTLIMATNLQHPNTLIGLINIEASAMMPTPFETAHAILVIILVVSLGQQREIRQVYASAQFRYSMRYPQSSMS